MPLDRRAARLLAMLAATGGDAGAASVTARRAALASLAEMADDASTPAETHQRAIPGPDGPIPIRLYAPQATADRTLPALVFFHGGGWVAGDLSTHDGFCRRLAVASDARVIAVDYRLAPEHRFPGGLADAVAATQWVARHARELGVDPARLGVGGDSAGGGLAAAVAQASRADGRPDLALQLLICPILDVARDDGSRAEFAEGHFISDVAFAQDLADYLPDGFDTGDPRVSPAKAETLASLPPALIHTAEFDPFRDEGEAYGRALQQAGVAATVTRHPGMIHYFYALARAIPYAAEAAELIGTQVREALG